MSKVTDLVDELVGTCNNTIPEEELDTPEQLVEFDSLAFCCDQCGWWCSTDELNNDTDLSLCDDCVEESQ